uniref:NusG antitermination factor n=1 Tax=Solibacter usitatus (strain Ellin6076) TaxID=234267 RepID=Q01XJ6_SOLUE
MHPPQAFLGESAIAEPALPWFAVKVRSNFEKKSADILREKGYQEFAPSYPSRRYWSDRVKVIDQPLFPGYVFCRFHPNHFLPVLQTAGVVQIVGFGGKLAPVDEVELASLRTLMNSSLPISQREFLHVGRKVLIRRGPLAGVEGILEEIRKGYRIVVSISLLQRSVTAEIDANWVTTVQ